ncbi:aminopeptidase [Flavobacteriaceae bacterium TK19130]|nr:aminopeptidase [Thermobacterium salinum]
MRNFFLCFVFLFCGIGAFSQEPYQFETVIDLDATPVISQGRTGTCWSFSTSSFLESEIIRLTGTEIDLSEMYTVRNIYPKKAENFVMRQGKAQFSEGGLAHDVMTSVEKYGLVPQQVYSGYSEGSDYHNHAELIATLSAMLDTYTDKPGGSLSPKWKEAVNAVLDVYLGEKPEAFTYQGKQYTPESFRKMTKLNPDDYVTLTSFTHEPFYSTFILNIPDNWSNGSFYNLPLDEMMQTVHHALQNGYTVELDCDVSERTFSSKDGVAVIPKDDDNKVKSLQGLYPEKNITQEYRQEQFENYATTDDHLMHITGQLRDQNGNTYYKVKNSWGTDESRTTNDGYVYFSEPYMRLKTISVMVHKDALPKTISKKLNL